MAVLIFAACFSSFLAPADPFEIDTKNILKGPSRQHPFGTDQIGRDILSDKDMRRIRGNRIAMIFQEPTTASDITIQAQILELIHRLRVNTGTAIFLITHDLGVIAKMADTVAVMYLGKIV